MNLIAIWINQNRNSNHRSAAILRKSKQAKPLLQQNDQNIARVELVELIYSLGSFVPETDQQLQLERDTRRMWQKPKRWRPQ